MMRFIQHRERGSCDPFKNLTPRLGPREDTDAKQYAEQQPRHLAGFDIG
jgi:hypothetical protein